MDHEEKKLVNQARQGNITAFEELVKQYEKRVMALAVQLVGNTDDAEDIYQEVFIKVFQNLHKFRSESSFYTWLYRIVVNCAINYRKKRNRQRYQSLDEMLERNDGWQWIPKAKETDMDSLLIHKELMEQIHFNLDSLSMMQRVVFILRFFQDFQIKEISEVIGCTEGTVKNYLFRGTQKMRKKLSIYLKT